ncbi:MAG: PIN domain-containing protein [Deltaproteobacteria bacterium]|nr:PIN domain-containing protein [Deltaproteobacteria bacterium]
MDTSAIVALLCGWHERHAETMRGVEERIRRGYSLVVPAHALVETYAVLTRLPAPHRLSGEVAFRLLRQNFRSSARVRALAAAEYWTVLADAVDSGIAGGATYDAVVATSARKGGATCLLTLNLRHFASFQRPGFEVLEPGLRRAT